MALGLTEAMNIAADPQKAANFLEGYSLQGLGDLDRRELRGIQRVLSALGFYPAKPHPYYADGINGEFTVRGFEMAQLLYSPSGEAPDSAIHSNLTGRIIAETQELIDSRHLSSSQILHLQQNLKYLNRIDGLDEGENFALDPGKIDGYMGSKTAKAALEFARKYSKGMRPSSAIGRELEREKIDFSDHVAPDLAPVSGSSSLKEILSSHVMSSSKIEDLQEALTGMGLNPGGVDGVAGPKTINGVDGQGGLMAAIKDDPALFIDMSRDALKMVWEHASPDNRSWLRENWEQTFPEGTERAGWIDSVASAGHRERVPLTLSSERPQGYASIDDRLRVPDHAWPVLKLVSWAESKDDPNIMFGETKNGTRKYDLVNMTVADVRDARVSSKSDAAGLYQIISNNTQDTLRGAQNIMARDFGIPVAESEQLLFDENLQHFMGYVLLRDAGFERYCRGEISEARFVDNVSKVWASFEGMDGHGAYDNDGLNKAYIDTSDVIKAARLAKITYQNENSGLALSTDQGPSAGPGV